ncbi:restriction endonuclease subunit S [Aeromonas veronii]|uniref:restriction endonuclease subunit S n=1 Tax=Aeromonas veronii TaxID=654 RepID=UPI0027DE0BE1|nr:restriction endonuclease subunit S [Aeromonas veronii]WMJ05063.1 restriction endonuclease subunit S [Aeromonas veronii]
MAALKIENLITDHLDLWTAAVRPKSSTGRGSNSKLELIGIKKLRELILELSVRGKLVPQDPNDEPASVLLERIAAEKTRLVKEGKIKKPKALPEISEEEKRFELPEGWAELRLGAAINVLNGRAYKKHEMLESGTPLLRVGNLFTSDKWYYSDLELEPEKYIDNGDLIYSWSASFGPFIWNGGRVIYHYHIWKMDIFDPDSLDKHFMCLYLDAISASIKASGNGIAMVHMTKEKMEQLVIPIPPISEQHRIVAKVDELMALCDQLEQHSESQLAAHQTLVETLLATLTDSCDADELAQNWARLSTHFDTLFTTEASIDALKQTILQLAVMGKLVPQDPSDEPASVLLERIAAKKAQLVKEKKIKKEKPLPAIGENEKPFELPQGWVFERIAVFGLVGTGATPSRSNPAYWEPAEINWVSSGETAELFVGKTKEQISNLAIKETNVSIYPAGTLIVAMYGQGKTRGQITELLEPAGTNQACAAIRLIDETKAHKDFVKLFFRKAYLELREHAAGGAQPNLNVGKIASTVIPLPPIPEQHRIVAKVDELMTLCDQLKARLQTSQQTQLALAESLVEGALS